MRSTRSKLLVTGMTVLSLLAVSACGTTTGGSAGAPKPGSKGTVKIAVLPWLGYDADVAVVSRILQTRLGYKVEKPTTTAKDMWSLMESGGADTVLENWGHAADKKTYVDEKKTVIDAGVSGNQGVIGWYVPMWMVQQYPDIRDWRNLNKYAKLFETPDSGGKGRVLDGDKSYTTNDPALVANLRLNYSVTYSGSEDETVKAALAASTNHTPLLFYFWEPHWLFNQQKFAKINLPLYRAGCDTDPATVACDYAPYVLDKLASKKFADSGGAAYELIKNFTWTNDDQNEVASYLANDHLNQDDAAKKWMDAHPDTWESWLPA
jgi:glycine betaine/proline transport system substrate-binding protein